MRMSVRLVMLPVSLMLSVLGGAVSAQQTPLKVNDQLTVPQWVNPDVPGQLSGRLILPTVDGSSQPIGDAVLVMTDSTGKSVRTASSETGEFTFTDVQPGVYALAARAPGVFACCAMQVVDPTMPAAEIYPSQVEISAAAIDYTIIKTSIIRYLPPTSGESSFNIKTADLRGISSRVVGENNFRVLQDEGGLKGRIHMAGATGSKLGDARLLNVFLISGGETIDHIVSSIEGSFNFKNVAPGEYSILAIGEAGLGMAGFELVDESSMVARSGKTTGGETFVAAMDDCCCCCAEFSMQVAPLPMAIESMEVISSDPIIENQIVEGELPPGAVDQFGNPIGQAPGVDAFGNPIGGGYGGTGYGGTGYGGGGYGGGGGGGFGGGGGGFGGGLGGLASLAGLGALAGLGNNDNNGGGGVFNPPPVPSPAVPAP